MAGVSLGLVVLGLLLEPSPSGLSLRYEVPASCPPAELISARVQELLGSSPEGSAAVRVVASGAGYQATVQLQTADGVTTRQFQGGSCAGVAEATALVIAVGLDPVAVAHELDAPADDPDPPSRSSDLPAPAEPLRAPAPGLPPSLGDTAPIAVATAPAPIRPPITVRAQAQGGLALGLFPQSGANVGGAVAMTYGSFRLEGGGVYEVARRFEHSQDSGVAAVVSAAAGRLAVCWNPTVEAFAFPLCAAAEVGWVTARGRGLEESRTTRSPWASAVGGARALWFPTRALGMGFMVEVPISLRRARFGVDDFESDIVQVGRVGGRIGLTLEVIFFDENRRRRR